MKNSSNIDTIKLLDMQEFASICYLITTAIAIYLTHYRKQIIRHQKTYLKV